MEHKEELVLEEIQAINSSIYKINCPPCSNCPGKLFYKSNDQILFGLGNLNTNTIFIIREYNMDIINIICKLYNDITNKNFIYEYYITSFIKCNNTVQNNIFNGCVKNCNIYINYEINKLNPSNIVILNSNKDIINNIRYNFNNKKISYTINPSVYFTNKELYEIFKRQFIKIIYKYNL